MSSEFLYGPSYDDLQEEGFARVAESASERPTSILWLEQNDHRLDAIADAWALDHGPLRLETTTLDRMVGECYEELAGPQNILDALTRRQLVDDALRDVDAEGLLDEAHRHRGDVMSLFTEIEGQGYDSTTEFQSLVTASQLSDRAGRFLEATYEGYRENLDAVVDAFEFTQSHAYQAVLDSNEPIDALLPDTDVVVLSGYHDLSTQQEAVLEQLADSIDLYMLLPLVNPDRVFDGADRVARDAATFYQDLADETTQVTESETALSQVSRKLYTPAGAGETAIAPEQLQWVEAPTPDREIRQVARSLRKRLATDDLDPDDVLVVVPGLISYREHIEDIFPAHGLEVATFANKLLYQTHTGDAILALVAACEDDVTADLLARLATNPLVTLDGVDPAAVADLSRRLPTNDHERLLEEVDSPSRSAFKTILEKTEQVTDSSESDTIPELRNLFEYVSLAENIEEIDRNAESFDVRMEQRAFSRFERALAAIQRLERTLGVSEVLERVSDELDQIRVPPPRASTNGVLEVVGPRDAFMQSYEHLYLVGLTARDFPPNPETPRFFTEIENGLDGITTQDERLVARYQFATMLSNASSVYITTPESTADDDPMLPSSLLDELSRVTGLEPTTEELGNGCREDVQQSIGKPQTCDSASDLVEKAIEAGTYEGVHATRLRRGVECAQHRASPQRTVHDGQLDPETVASLHPQSEREPYSPTQLSQYAACGFQYYMDRVLDIDAPEEFKLEPDPLDLGSLVHDILEAFYTSLQDAPGEPVDLQKYPREQLEERLLEVGLDELQRHALPYNDVFYHGWLRALFAGLGTPSVNEYYHAEQSGVHNQSSGVFARFLDVELDKDANPGWFEVELDLTTDEDAVFELELEDGRTIPLGGRIDRVTVETTEETKTGLVHDYKSSRQSTREAVDGVSFQLPLYALAAGRRLEADGVQTPVDATYYILDPPDDVSEMWTLRYYIQRIGDATDADYQRLIEHETPRRIGEIVDGIAGGAFQPTVIDEQTAGCRYCDYSEVCDVRPHRRRDVVAAMDADGEPGYIPQYARETSLLDQFGGDTE